MPEGWQCQISIVLERSFGFNAGPQKATCLCSAHPAHTSLCHPPTSLSASHCYPPWGILSHIFWPKLPIHQLSPGRPQCDSFAPHSFLVKPLLYRCAHSLCNTHPHLNSTDLFPPQCFSLPAAKSPSLVLLLLHSSVFTDLSLRLLYLYLIYIYIVFFTVKCFLGEKKQNISYWLVYTPD